MQPRPEVDCINTRRAALVSFDLDGFIVGHQVAKRSVPCSAPTIGQRERLYRRRARAVAYRATNATQIDQKKSRLFAIAAVSLTAASAQAFTQENLGTSGVGNSAFADPDGQVKNFGHGAQPFGPNGPVVQFGAQKGTLTPFGRFQGSGFNNAPPPDPYSRPLGNGN